MFCSNKDTAEINIVKSTIRKIPHKEGAGVMEEAATANSVGFSIISRVTTQL